MLLTRLAINKDVVKVVTKNLPIEGCITYVIIRMKVLEVLVNLKGMTIHSYNLYSFWRGFPFIFRTDANLVINTFSIDCWKDGGIIHHIQHITQSWNGKMVLCCSFVDGTSIHTYTKIYLSLASARQEPRKDLILSWIVFSHQLINLPLEFNMFGRIHLVVWQVGETSSWD